MSIDYLKYAQSPYHDDFDEDKKFLKMLFRPGFAVQTRELNQLQTYLQNQIERLGNHLFVEGAMVVPGYTKFDSRVAYVKITYDESRHTAEYIRENLIGKVITNIDPTTTVPEDTRVRALVLDALSPDNEILTGSDYTVNYYDGMLILYVRYLSGNSGTVTFEANDSVYTESAVDPQALHTSTVETVPDDPNAGSVDSTKVAGIATMATIDRGIYYTKGYFVLVDKHSTVVDPFSGSANARVGLQATEIIITPDDDNSINDNALGTPNFFAPGAHRLKIDLSLKTIPLGTEGTDEENGFIELIRVREGVLVKHVKRTIYNEIAKELARRTYNESGHYTVDPFLADIVERGGELYADLDPGVAYVNGFEIEKIAKTSVPVERSQDTSFENNRAINTQTGNYVRVTKVYGLPVFAFTGSASSSSVDGYMTVDLYDSPITAASAGQAPIVKNADGSTNATPIGTARVRNFQYQSGTPGSDDTVYRLYLFDIKINSGYSFKNVGYVRSSDGHFGAQINFVRQQLSGLAAINAPSNVITGEGLWNNPTDKRVPGDWIIYREYTSPTLGTFTEHFFQVTNTYPSGQQIDIAASTSLVNVTDVPVSYAYAALEQAGRNISIFPLPHENIDKIRNELDTDNDTRYTVLRVFEETVDGSSVVKINAPLPDEAFESYTPTKYFIYELNSTGGTGQIVAVDAQDVTYSVDEVSFDLSGYGIGASDEVRIIAPVIKTGGTSSAPRAKVLTDFIETFGSTTDTNILSRPLAKADVYEITAVVMSEAFSVTVTTTDPNTLVGTDIDITDRFTFDDGQRDNWYQEGRLILKDGQTPPSGQIKVFYKYFQHSTVGAKFFARESYSIAWEDIPAYVSTENGTTFQLRDCLDFRPLKIGGVYQETVEIAVDNVTADYHYYLNRIDKLYLDQGGTFRIKKGVPALDPKEPEDPTEGMTIYKLYVRAYTATVNDVITEFVENKRYTMRDIGKLEKRLDKLEYYTSLNMLEKDTADLEILDADGLDRFKNGFIVDPFSGHGIGDVQNVDYKIAIDMVRGEARTMFVEDMLPLQVYEGADGDPTGPYDGSVTQWPNGTDYTTDIGLGPAYQKTGDLITFPYHHEILVSQKIASNTVNVNPFAVFTFLGQIKLDPSLDEWKDTKTLPARVIEEEGNFSSLKSVVDGYGTIWGDWENNLAKPPVTNVVDQLTGFKMEIADSVQLHRDPLTGSVDDPTWTNVDPETGAPNGQWPVRWHYDYRTTTTTNINEIRRGTRLTAVPKIVTKNLGEKVIDVSYIPFMRSKDILFRAKGLKPHTQVLPFFDSVDVSDYVTAFENATDELTYDDSVALNGVLSDFGAQQLIADKNGAVSGIFRLPNSEALRFKTGHRFFTLTDDSTDGTEWSTRATAIYRAQGVQETKQDTIISTRNAEIVQEEVVGERTSIQTSQEDRTETGPWVDPIAQSFLVDTDGGAFITKVDVFFETKDTNIPVTLEIREMVNGYPGKRVVPFGRVIINPEEVITNQISSIANQLEVDINGSVELRVLNSLNLEPTTFTFDSPVYLQQNTEYAMVVMSNSNNYNVWVATVGQVDPNTAVDGQPGRTYTKLGTDEPLTKQPYAGSFFKSQNASTWSADQYVDMKFDIYRADFHIGGLDSSYHYNPTVLLHNQPLETETLVTNPVVTKAGTNKVRIIHRNHGFTYTYDPGTQNQFFVQIDGLIGDSSDEINGIPISYINGKVYEIVDLDLDSYTIEVTDNQTTPLPANATSTGRAGGSAAYAYKNLKMDAVKLSIGNSSVPNTSLNYRIRTTSSSTVHPVAYAPSILSDDFIDVPNDQLVEFTRPAAIVNDINEFPLGIIVGGKPYYAAEDAVARPSFWVEITMNSTNRNVSPVIDTKRLNAIVIGNRVDNPTETLMNVSSGDISNPGFDDDVIVPTGTGTLEVANGQIEFAGTDAEVSPFERMKEGRYIQLFGGTYNGEKYVIKEIEKGTTSASVKVHTQIMSGTVSTNGTSMSGAGTLFTSELSDGDMIIPVNAEHNIANARTVTIGDDNTLTLDIAFDKELSDEKVRLWLPDDATVDGLVYLSNFASELTPVGASGGSKYITRRLLLGTPSTALRISFGAYKPPTSEIDVYYKVSRVDDDTPFDEIPYEIASYDRVVPYSTSANNFKEHICTINGLPPFLAVAVKIVLRSTNSANPPKLVDFRCIALDA